MYELQQVIPGAQTVPGEYFPQELMPQTLIGGDLARRLGSTYGCGPSGSLGQRIPSLGWPLFATPPIGAGSAVQPMGVDPMALAAAYQPQQLRPQGLFGDLLGRRYSNTYGCGPSGSLGGPRPLLPFEVDPVALAYLQQAQQQQQFAPQAWAGNLTPFDVDPVAAAYAYQQAQAMRAML